MLQVLPHVNLWILWIVGCATCETGLIHYAEEVSPGIEPVGGQFWTFAFA